MYVTHESMGHGLLQHLYQGIVVSIGVDQHDGSEIDAEPLQRKRLEQFLKGATTAWQGNHGVGIHEHAVLALAHILYELQMSKARMAPLEIRHEARQDSHHRAAGLQRAVRQLAHRAATASAIDDFQPGAGKLLAQGECGGVERRIDGVRRRAVNADSFHDKSRNVKDSATVSFAAMKTRTHMRGLSIVALLTALCLAPTAPAQDSESSDRIRVGVALSGGGARGLAHVGVLKALEELQIPVDAIAGTSMGSVVGALYASGLSADDIAQMLGEIPWNDVFRGEGNWADRSLQGKQESRAYFLGLEFGSTGKNAGSPAGVLAGQELELLLRRLFDGVDQQYFSDLHIPFRSVATDVNSAQYHVMAEGDLVSALRASMAIPLVFEPVERDGRVLVDGGILNNLPVDVVRDMDVDVVIAVDVSSPLGEVSGSSSLFRVTYQSIDAALVQNTIASLATADLVIAPPLGELTAADFEQFEQLVERGYEGTLSKRLFLDALGTTEPSYAAWRKRLQRPETSAPEAPVAFVRFTGNERVATARLEAMGRELVGQPAATDRIEGVVEDIYTMQSFINVGYHFVTDDSGRKGIEFLLREKPWGPNYFKVGFTIASDIDVATDFRLNVGHRRRNVNRLGAEWRNDLQVGTEVGLYSELYQPFQYETGWFVAPYFLADTTIQRTFEDDVRVAEFEVFRRRLGADVGYDWEDSRVRLGLWTGLIDSQREVGTGGFPIFEDDQGAIRLSFEHDSLNQKVFATNGARIDARYDRFLTGLGAEEDYHSFTFDGSWRKPLGEASAWHLRAQGAWLEGAEKPASAYTTLGGINNLSGFGRGSLIGDRSLFLELGVLSGIQPLELPVIGAPRILSTLHAGNVWAPGENTDLDDLRIGATSGIAVDLLGAVFFAGAGYTDGGKARYYLRVGTDF